MVANILELLKYENKEVNLKANKFMNIIFIDSFGLNCNS